MQKESKNGYNNNATKREKTFEYGMNLTSFISSLFFNPNERWGDEKRRNKKNAVFCYSFY
jgi:hypothetical protein